ncbi:MAG TPA: DUF5675 family protein [Saprospiraceae bacterium]|nr:DUF5675 family protein [Saprospiraceae bacterium]
MSVELSLNRILHTFNSTAGAFWHGDKFLFFTIEDGKRVVKIHGITCIPAGRYRCQKATDTRFNEKYKKDYGHTWVMRILDVPGFDGIEIHIFNRVEESHGCIGPNMTLAFEKSSGNFKGIDSGTAYQGFYNYIESLHDDEIWLTIT